MPNNEIDYKKRVNKAIIKYQTSIDKNVTEGEILWNRYNAMLVFNSILIAAIGLTFQPTIKLPPIITVFLPIAGLISCYLWFITSLRGFQWIHFWIASARKIEEEYLTDENEELNPIINALEHKSEIIGWPRVETASYFLIIIVGIIYILFLLKSLNIL